MSTTTASFPEILAYLTTPFRAFTRSDWEGFSGCESENPMITEYEIPGGEAGLVILDGEEVLVLSHDDEYGGRTFRAIER